MYIAWVPANFLADFSLDKELAKFLDNACFLVHTIRHQQISDSRLKGGGVPLKASYLANLFPNYNDFLKIRDCLEDHGVIHVKKQYVAGKQSFIYTILPAFANQVFVKHYITNKKLINKLKDNKYFLNVYTPKSVHKHLYGFLRKLEVEADAAIAHINSTERDDPYLDIQHVAKIREKDFFFGPCPYNRCHHNITNFPSDCRQFLRLDGQSLVNIDIRNSQPLFFVLLILDKIGIIKDKPKKVSGKIKSYVDQRAAINPFAREYVDLGFPLDVIAYIELVQTGQLYEFLMQEWDIPLEKRAKFKKNFFGAVFFCQLLPQYEKSRLFQGLFPNVFEVIREYKKRDFKNLAHTLQKSESALMIHGASVRIMKERPSLWFTTIHDSILTLEGDAAYVESVIKEEFLKKNIRPTIRVERY